MESLLELFRNGSYAPHGYCLLWQPELIWTHIIADSLIAAAYFSIPIALVMLVRRRRDLEFGRVFWCFALFILACGFTHVMSIWTLYQSVYGLEALVKAITAVASVATAIMLWPLLPRAVALPSPERLQRANAELAALVAERDAALLELRTEVKQRERAEAALLQSQKLEAVGQLTGGIAHDFNNLLQAVAGNLELIAGVSDGDGKVHQWSRRALDAVERGRSLTGQLLAFSRKQRLELASVPVAEMLEGMRDLIERAVAPLAHVNIQSISPSLTVVADPLQLELAILNLAFNARDAMPDGGTLQISASAMSGATPNGLETGDWVALSVSDNGTGMTPEIAARAMEPFYTTKDVGRGTGMGLAMVFGVVTQSGGTVTIDTTPGKGTRITFWLRPGGSVAPRATPEALPSGEIRLTGRRILVVDDNVNVRLAVADTLLAAGAFVVQAQDGSAAQAILAESRPDLVLADFAMPGMTGAELAEYIRKTDSRLPILILTGFADSSKLKDIGGAIDVVRKPVEAEVLLRRIDSMLS